MIFSGMSGILLRNASSGHTYITHTVKTKVCVVYSRGGCFRMFLSFSLQVGDRTGQITAQMNISDLRALLGIEDESRER